MVEAESWRIGDSGPVDVLLEGQRVLAFCGVDGAVDGVEENGDEKEREN
jgi:hypothetical protein